jgi:DNA-directed RNA polymerase subunit K/omega
MSILLQKLEYKKGLELIRKYPKRRPPLNKKLKKIFDFEYKKNRTNLLSQLSESWLHFSIKGREEGFYTSLEIGAGTLNHIPYEKIERKKYDVIEPKKFLYKNNKKKALINKFYKDLNVVPNNNYDRIISCAVLEHLEDLPKYLYLSTKKLKKNGFQSHSIPCEGYPVWDIAWYLMSGISFKLRTGQNFKDVQKHEHINNYNEILALCNIVRNDKGIIVDELHRTYPFITKYEYARIVGIRSKQLNNGADPFIKLARGVIDGFTIAKLEMDAKKVPFIIARPLPNGSREYWKVQDLEMIHF